MELTRLRALARLLDSALRVPGTRIRFGLDALVGLIPGLGDVTAGLATSYTLVAAQRMGAPPAVLLHMVWNVVIDTVLGSVPLLGDLFDVGYKANLRNVALLEKYLASPVKARHASRAFLILLLVLVALIVASGLVLTYLMVRALWRAWS